MAKIVSSGNNNTSRLESTGQDRRKELSTKVKSNRATQELNIANDAKKYLDSFFTTLNDAPSMLGDYYSRHVGESTTSENLNNQKLISSTTKYNKIENFVMWAPKNNEEIEKKGDEDREVSYSVTDQEAIIVQGTITPVVGDHWVFRSQGIQAVPYMVTDVRSLKMVDKAVYAVILSPSNTFTTSSLEKSVVETYSFVFGNVGTQRKTLLVKNTYDRISHVNKLLNDLNSMYVDAFYDDKYDLLRFNSNLNSSIFIGCKALREFQNNTGILRYGADMNMLFCNYPFITKKDVVDYRKSYIYSILKRKLSKKNNLESTVLPNDMSGMMIADFETRRLLNEEVIEMLDEDNYELISEYESLNNYKFKFYFVKRTDFSILTNLRKSGIVLNELNSMPRNLLTSESEHFINYELDSKIFKYILDMWMDEKYIDILNSNILDEYLISNNNIDDYLMLPIIMHILSMCINYVETDDMIVTF